jgi:hypothetical protein
MIKNVIDNKTGLSYEIIDDCTDRDQLLQWRFEFNEAIQEIKNDIQSYEFNYNPENGHEKFDWYMRVKLAKNIKVRIVHYIDWRISKLNKIIKQENIERSRLEHIEYLKTKT